MLWVQAAGSFCCEGWTGYTMTAQPLAIPTLTKRGQSAAMEDKLKEILSFHERSFQFALHCCRGDRAEAEDVLQQAYTYAVSGGLDSFRGEAQLRTWWFGVLRQTAHGFFRTLTRRAKRLLSFKEDPLPEKTPEHVTEEREKSRRLALLLYRLPEAQRLSLQLYYYEEMTLEEISSVLASPKTTIQSRIKAGEKALQALLEEEGLR